MGISLKRVLLGSALNMLMIVMSAYALSKDNDKFRMRTAYAWFFFITMIFNGGLIPRYFVVQATGLMDSIWALVIPGCVQVFNVILMMNFFRQLPVELEEAAYLDGAGHWIVLFKVFLPVSKPALATILLFSVVQHWNEWFHGIIYMNKPTSYPLQSYLRMLISPDTSNFDMSDDSLTLLDVNAETSKAAQIFVAAVPILMIYPFLQKYFTTGLTLGSVKG